MAAIVREDCTSALTAAGSERSTRRRGHCRDNAAVKSFGSTLKPGTGPTAAVPVSRRAADLIAFDDIERVHSPTRRHSSRDYLSLWVSKLNQWETTSQLPESMSIFRGQPNSGLPRRSYRAQLSSPYR